MSQGVYVLGGKCPGGKCPGGKCPGGICPWGKRPGGTCPGGLCPRTAIKTSGEKGWGRGFESRRGQLAIRIPSSGKTCCYIKGQSFLYYVYVVWEVKEPLSW